MLHVHALDACRPDKNFCRVLLCETWTTKTKPRRLRHENIIGFYGACIAKPKLCIVQELAFGSLYDFLHVKKLRPDPGTLLRVGIDIASAMDYCHSLATPVIHRDLKSQNILLDADGRAKVADFGIARAKQHTFLTTKHVNAGTIAYMAPELFSAGYVDESTRK